MKIFILDANNIIHKDTELKRNFEASPTGATTAFLHRIEQYNSKYPSYKFIIFFDSIQQLIPKYSTISLHWSTNGEDADTLIKHHLERSTITSSMTVVSSDSEVRSVAKRYHCSVLSSAEFLANIKPTKSLHSSNSTSSFTQTEKPNRTTKKEMNEFKELFSTKR